ncbi:MAG: MBL fold metallo-hydrolase [Syntrophales bacterium]|nr:MBL fold metallo-hydrolase [Syntrophales bacterium]
MKRTGKLLRANQPTGSGRVVEYCLGRRRRLFQITTFCPDIIGPGPTNQYLIEDEALILVDTGIPTGLVKNFFYFWQNQPIPDHIEALSDDYSEQELLSAINLTGHDVRDIGFIVLTHGHFDHYLLGRKLVKMSGAKVAAHVLDSGLITNKWSLMKVWIERRPLYRAMGMPLPENRINSRNRPTMEDVDLSLGVDYPIISDGPLRIGDFKSDAISVCHSAGHSPGGISLLVQNEEGTGVLMLCGDTLLYPITPHPDDLVAYLRALKKIKSLENIALVLPAHGKAIAKLRERLAFLEMHHKRRLQLTYEACKEPRSIWQIATIPHYFDVPVDPAKFNPLAGQEAMVHVELLQLAGGLRTSRVDGTVHYFQNSGEAFADIYNRILNIIDDENTTVLLRR